MLKRFDLFCDNQSLHIKTCAPPRVGSKVAVAPVCFMRYASIAREPEVLRPPSAPDSSAPNVPSASFAYTYEKAEVGWLANRAKGAMRSYSRTQTYTKPRFRLSSPAAACLQHWVWEHGNKNELSVRDLSFSLQTSYTAAVLRPQYCKTRLTLPLAMSL